MTSARKQWSSELQTRIGSVVGPGDIVHTLSAHRPNWIVDVSPEGVLVHTEKSKDEGEPQLVDGWMFQVAWDHLMRHGELTNTTLLNDLGVKRSSAVSAILAQLPEVEVISLEPITLLLSDR